MTEDFTPEQRAQLVRNTLADMVNNNERVAELPDDGVVVGWPHGWFMQHKEGRWQQGGLLWATVMVEDDYLVRQAQSGLVRNGKAEMAQVYTLAEAKALVTALNSESIALLRAQLEGGEA
jgi:hypothetical protein